MNWMKIFYALKICIVVGGAASVGAIFWEMVFAGAAQKIVGFDAAAFGASSIFSPTQNPGLAGGLAAASAVIGPGLQYAARGPVGVFANLLIQMNAGPLPG